jgi:hypothetical protein
MRQTLALEMAALGMMQVLILGMMAAAVTL